MGRPIKGKEVKQVCSIRLEPKIKKALIKKFGSLQVAIDSFLESLCTK
jgi:hypothetical protein